MSEVDLNYKLWLHSLKLSNTEKILLLNQLGNEKEIYDNFEEIIKCCKTNSLYLCGYNKCKELNEIYKTVTYLDKNKIKFLSYDESDYPDQLKHIKEAPYALFYKGNINLLKSRIVAIVGSRSCTNYGVEVTKLLTNFLNSYNITIISGGARGIDSVAHRNAIKYDGKTIVVLGCGIDVVYPKENYTLFNSIEQSGLLISEFFPKTPPYKYNFPIRNRIISGLAELVIVVEASENSGTLITATYAAEQGKEVMAVPGLIMNKESKGCHKLLQEGACLFTGIDDLHYILKLNKKTSNKILPINDRILSVIEYSPTHIDDIINKSLIDRESLYKILFEMQIRKEIICLPGNFYAKII